MVTDGPGFQIICQEELTILSKTTGIVRWNPKRFSWKTELWKYCRATLLFHPILKMIFWGQSKRTTVLTRGLKKIPGRAVWRLRSGIRFLISIACSRRLMRGEDMNCLKVCSMMLREEMNDLTELNLKYGLLMKSISSIWDKILLSFVLEVNFFFNHSYTFLTLAYCCFRSRWYFLLLKNGMRKCLECC